MTIPTTPYSSNHNASAASNIANQMVDGVKERAEEASDAARMARNEFQKVRYELGKVATKGEKLAKENPWATAGTMFGIGALLGALAYKLLAPKPTVSSVLGVSHLPDAARSQFNKQLKQLRKMF